MEISLCAVQAKQDTVASGESDRLTVNVWKTVKYPRTQFILAPNMKVQGISGETICLQNIGTFFPFMSIVLTADETIL